MKLKTIARYVLLALLSLALVAYYFLRFSLHPAGLALYSEAAECMLRHQPIDTCSPAFTYPPLFAFLIIPLTVLPVWTQTALWYVILVAFTYFSYRVSEILVLTTLKEPLTPGMLAGFRILCWILSLNFILAVFENQAFDILVFFFVLVGLLGLQRRKLSWTVSGLALAAAMKATPALFFPYLALRRRWKETLFSVASYLGLSLLPDLFFRISDGKGMYLGNWIRQVALQPYASGISQGGMPTFWTGENPLNQSLRPLVLHLAAALGIQENFSLILYGIYGFCLCFGLWALSRSAELQSTTIDGSLILTGMLLLSPMSSKSHFIVLMLPLMLVTAQAFGNADLRHKLIGAVTLSFVLGNLTSKDLVGSAMAEKAGRWSSITVATIILAVAITYIVWSEQQDHSEKLP